MYAIAKSNKVKLATPYIIYNPHQQASPTKKNYIQLGNIDPGAKDGGFRITRFYDTRVETIKFLRTRFIDSLSIKDQSPLEAAADAAGHFKECTAFLKQHQAELEECHFITVESQMTVNMAMCRLSQHIISTLSLLLEDKGNRPFIVEMDSHLKTKLLGAPSMKKEEDRKKWCYGKAIDILTARGDTESLSLILSIKGRKFDLTDVVCQEMAFMVILDSTPSLIPRE